MAQAERKHVEEPTVKIVDQSRSIILSVDDGVDGHYITVDVPQITGTDEQKTTYVVGFNYDALRKGQAEAKKLRKAGKNKDEVRSALSVWASNYTPSADAERVETVATKRNSVASEMLKARLIEMGKPHDDATLTLNLPAYLGKYAEKVDNALGSFLSGGYTPTRKGEGKAVTATSSGVVVDDI